MPIPPTKQVDVLQDALPELMNDLQEVFVYASGANPWENWEVKPDYTCWFWFTALNH